MFILSYRNKIVVQCHSIGNWSIWPAFCIRNFQMHISEGNVWISITNDWSLFLMVQLIMIQVWFRWWIGAEEAISHYLNQWWPNSLTHICVIRPQWIKTMISNHWKPRVGIMPTRPGNIFTTTSGATKDDKVSIMTTLGFPRTACQKNLNLTPAIVPNIPKQPIIRLYEGRYTKGATSFKHTLMQTADVGVIMEIIFSR